MKVDVETSVSKGMAGSTYKTSVTIEGEYEGGYYRVASNPPIPKGHIETAMTEGRRTIVAAIEAHGKAVAK